MTISPSRDTYRDDVRSALNAMGPERLCERLGLTKKTGRLAGGLMCVCPACGGGENSPPFSCTTDSSGDLKGRCFSCGASYGDAFGLVALVERLDVHADFAAVLAKAGEIAGVAPPVDGASPRPRPALRSVPAAPPAPPPPDRTAEWDALPPVDAECLAYLTSRGLAAAAGWCRSPKPTHWPKDAKWADIPQAEQLGAAAALGYRLAVALRDMKGHVVAIQLRRLTSPTDPAAKAKRFIVSGRSAAGCFGEPHKVAGAKIVICPEGLTDSLATLVTMQGIPDVAVAGIAGTQGAEGFLSLPLAGKRVIIPFDADLPTKQGHRPGDEAAEQLEAELRRRKARPYRARPPEGQDVCDLFRAGGPARLRDHFREALTQFRSVATDASEERASRAATADRILEFGISFLDHAYGGIFPDDLILVGAPTGKGKTATTVGTAMHNAKRGKAVHVIALEAARYEWVRRIKYPIIQRLVYENRRTNMALYRACNYLDWYAGKLDGALGRYEVAATEEIQRDYRSLFCRYKGADKFDKDTLRQSIEDIADETDITIVDHLHYVDTDDPNENRGTKLIVQTVRDVQNRLGKPVILVVHIRKADRGRKKPQLVPGLDDIHGSSDSSKISTKAVLLSPAYEENQPHWYLYPTFLDAAKCRTSGDRARWTALALWNMHTGQYEPEYEIGQLVQDRTVFQRAEPKQIPRWAIGNKTPRAVDFDEDMQ